MFWWVGLVGFVIVLFLFNWFKVWDNKFFVYYFMYDYVYLVLIKGSNLFELEV